MRTLTPACIQILFLRPSCPAPAAPAVVGPLTQFKQKSLEHPTAVKVEGRSQNRYTEAPAGADPADQAHLSISELVLMVTNNRLHLSAYKQSTTRHVAHC